MDGLRTLLDRSIDPGQVVLVRLDLNVPLMAGASRGKRLVLDDTKLQGSMATLRNIGQQGGISVVISHLGRPQGVPDQRLSLQLLRGRLKHLVANAGLGATYWVDRGGLPQSPGWDPEALMNRLAYLREKGGRGVILMENLRFDWREEKAGSGRSFAGGLKELTGAKVYVNDAFGVAHRDHTSVSVLPRLFERPIAGMLMVREVRALNRIMSEQLPRRVALIMGGNKLESKKAAAIAMMQSGMVNYLLLGSAAYSDLVVVDELYRVACDCGVEMKCPVDAKFQQGAVIDIGPRTLEGYLGIVRQSCSVIWNGTLGTMQNEEGSRGTRLLMQEMRSVQSRGVVVIGGASTLLAAKEARVAELLTHVSTGGGAMLAYLAGLPMPGIEPLKLESRVAM